MTKDSLLEIQENGYCVLRRHFSRRSVDACREAFWPILLAYLEKLHRAGIRYKDLHTSQSSLEEIFVGLVGRAQ